jgi:rhodanese-related sulfurtransferase
MPLQDDAAYAGDMPSAEAFRVLEGDAAAMLIDVRTRAEWAYVGAPDLSSLGKEVLFLEWQSFPAMQVDESFAVRLAGMLETSGIERGAPLLFLCRSGARSKQAAIAMTTAGWSACFNVSDGFEGPADASGHRGLVAGWKATGLPWMQT